jgi:hypothetical protein
VAPRRDTKNWTDRQLDDALLRLRNQLPPNNPGTVVDFYEPVLRARWAPERKVKTLDGEVTVVVPTDGDEEEQEQEVGVEVPSDARQSIQIQAKLAEIAFIHSARGSDRRPAWPMTARAPCTICRRR